MRALERLGNRFGGDVVKRDGDDDVKQPLNAPPPPLSDPYNNQNIEQQQQQQSTNKTNQKEMKLGGRIQGIRTLVPGYEYDVTTAQGRHDYMENLFDRYGRAMNIIPFILILAIASTNPTAAIWTAFSFNCFIVIASIYRSRYNPKVPFIPILTLGMTIVYLGQGIANQVIAGGMPHYLISPITCSGVFATGLFSMIICIPFTIQTTRLKVSDEVANSWKFVIFNQMITSIWVAAFAIMTISSWCGNLLFTDTKSVGYIMLSTVTPILVLVIAFLITPPIAKCIKDRSEKAQEKKDDDKRNDVEKDEVVNEEEQEGMLAYGEQE